MTVDEPARTREELLLEGLVWARKADCGCCSRGELPDDPEVRALIEEVDAYK